MENDMTHLAFCQQFEDAEMTTRDAREKAERDRDYYDEKQWTADEVSALNKRKQPVVTYNRIKRKVNALLGMERQQRRDPKAFPRNPNDGQSADAATDALRFVCDDSNWDDIRSAAAKQLVVEGTCAVHVGHKRARGGIDPSIALIAWDRFYHDPYSSAADFSDAAFLGQVVWMELDRAKAKYPDRAEVLESTWLMSRGSDTYDDKPRDRMWADYKRKRVRVCEHYYLTAEGWLLCHFTRGGFLVDPQPSPYEGEDGPECPIKAVSLYVDRDNNRYGEVRTMIGPQDEVNKRRSKALHLFTMRQSRVSRSAGVDKDALRAELAKPDGVITADRDEFEVLPTGDMAAANFQMLQEAKAEIDLLGPNAALQGKNEQAMSGRALQAQQLGGMIESAIIFDRIRSLSLSVYRSAWMRVRQFWTGERWVRVTDDDQNMRFVGLNRVVTQGEAMAEKMGISRDNWAEFAQSSPDEAQRFALWLQSPEAQSQVVENDLAEMDVDVVIDEGIDTPTSAAEQFEQLAKMAASGVPIPPDVLIEASSLRNKDRLLEVMRQNTDPSQQAAQQLQLEGLMAKIDKTKSETLKNLATADTSAANVEMGFAA